VRRSLRCRLAVGAEFRRDEPGYPFRACGVVISEWPTNLTRPIPEAYVACGSDPRLGVLSFL
jgi:hypothetical protein